MRIKPFLVLYEQVVFLDFSRQETGQVEPVIGQAHLSGNESDLDSTRLAARFFRSGHPCNTGTQDDQIVDAGGFVRRF